MKSIPSPVAGATLLVTFLLGAAPAAYARAPIVNIENAPIPAGLTMEEIEQTLVAGTFSRQGWTAQIVAPGHIEARVNVRSHSAVVDITFDERAYSITYKDSHNLDYKNGKIHGNYNKWVATLNGVLQRVLAERAVAGTGPSAAPAAQRGRSPAPTEAASTGVYSGGPVTIPATIGVASYVGAPLATSECRIGTLLAEQLASRSADIQIGDIANASHYLDLEITEIHMPGGGAWSGPKWMELTGALREGDGDLVSSFRAKRFSTGGALAVVKGSCKILGRTAKAIAQDVSRWLQSPLDGAQLGDAR